MLLLMNQPELKLLPAMLWDLTCQGPGGTFQGVTFPGPHGGMQGGLLGTGQLVQWQNQGQH